MCPQLSFPGTIAQYEDPNFDAQIGFSFKDSYQLIFWSVRYKHPKLEHNFVNSKGRNTIQLPLSELFLFCRANKQENQ